MSERLVIRPDPQPDIRKFTEANRGWEFQEEAAKLYRRAEVVMARFYPVFDLTKFEGQLPPVLIAIDSLRNKNTLAAYHLVPDEYGFNFKITFNEQHYVKGEEGKPVWEFGDWAQSETLVHEAGHHWQQLNGKNPFKPTSRVTHNKEFTDKMAQLGIHCEPEGFHSRIADVDSPFGILMKEWGITPPDAAPFGEEYDKHWWREFFKDQKKGRSTLHKWSCPDCGMSVRYGRKDDPLLIHAPCGSVLIRADAIDQTVYPQSESEIGRAGAN